jgi:predicted acetyltransferase
LRHVQFWETENSKRLDRSYRRGYRRDIPYLVDASNLRTVNSNRSSVPNERYFAIHEQQSRVAPLQLRERLNKHFGKSAESQLEATSSKRPAQAARHSHRLFADQLNAR